MMSKKMTPVKMLKEIKARAKAKNMTLDEWVKWYLSSDIIPLDDCRAIKWKDDEHA